MRQLIIVITLTLAIAHPSHAITVEDVPQPSEGSYIVDLANIFNSTFWCSSEGRDRGGGGNW